MAIRFLHTSDFHLGSPLRAVESASDHLASLSTTVDLDSF